jgi:hypothetical protein
MDNKKNQLVVFRNNLFFIGLVIFAGLVILAIALATMVMTFSTLFPLHGYTLGRALQVFWWALGSWLSASMGAALCRLGLKMANCEARLDSRGVDFRLGSQKDTREQFFAWDQIAAIKHKRIINPYYAIVGKDEQLVEFTAYTFFRAEKLAREIASQAGQPIQEIP